MFSELAIGYEDEAQKEQAVVLADDLNLPIDNQAQNKLVLTADKLILHVKPFLPLYSVFTRQFWQKRYQEGKNQGLIRACKPISGMRIIDATAGWGKDAAILASFGAEVLMLERNPIMAALLKDGLLRRGDEPCPLKLHLLNQDAITYLNDLKKPDYPHLIYLDPMHPTRQKAALVKKEMQVLQNLIEPDNDALELINVARARCLQKVVVKWPEQTPPLLKPSASIHGKTVRFDSYLPK
ncbi:N6-adenine-specific methylase [Legionella beliardensis]|uniref:Ribosomal RNA small subunit methyltransferase J n=1 Tax=Legionella beliardensis TaxID=91822 RepID=A0A378I336_9GAMM|nr:class I SAM-dependent methyltransferase [Legionella beliardensis]STX29597.1 N6-adenine-specific methylase [Legionella beliardensis]